MFMMNTDSGRFKDHSDLIDPVPLYEAKMLGLYDHRAADVVLSETALIRQGQSDELNLADKLDPMRFPQPRYWLERSAVDSRLQQIDSEGQIVWRWGRSWLLGWRDVTSPTNSRTTLPTIIPRVGVGHKFPLMLPQNEDATLAAGLLANLSSFVLDYYQVYWLYAKRSSPPISRLCERLGFAQYDASMCVASHPCRKTRSLHRVFRFFTQVRL